MTGARRFAWFQYYNDHGKRVTLRGESEIQRRYDNIDV